MIDVPRVFIKTIYCLIPILACTCNSISAQQDEKNIALAIEKLRMAMMNPDSVVLSDLACDGLEYVHSSGTVRDKKGFINEFMKRHTNVSNDFYSNQTIQFSGDLAIVRHRMVADAHNPGYPPRIDIIVMMVWRKDDVGWKMLARQAVKLGDK
jgi:hypothetical protein